jgi:hypothetical protein
MGDEAVEGSKTAEMTVLTFALLKQKSDFLNRR